MKNSPTFRAYVECALGSTYADYSEESDGTMLDDHADIYDLAPETRQSMRDCLAAFLFDNRRTIHASGLSLAQTARDLWLTQNRHGAGFWDRGLGDAGDELTEAAELCGSVDLYLGDDGMIYS